MNEFILKWTLKELRQSLVQISRGRRQRVRDGVNLTPYIDFEWSCPRPPPTLSLAYRLVTPML